MNDSIDCMNNKSKQKKKHISKKYIRGLLILAAFFLMCIHIRIVKGRDLVTFHWPENPRLYQYGCLFLFVIFTFIFYLLLLHCIYQIVCQNKVFLSYFKYFCLYFAFMCIFYILTWPGIFKGDEFYVIRSALDFEFSAAQSGLTSIFYIVSLLFFPSMATITFIQLLIICAIFAIIFQNAEELFPSYHRRLLYIPFILLPVIDGNLFTLRCTLAGWFFLLLVFKIYYVIKKDCLNLKYQIMFTILCGLITAWRSEYIYVFLLPLCAWLFKKIHIKRAILLTILCITFFSLFNVPNKIALNGSNKYPISLVLNPVGNLLRDSQSLKGPSVVDDIYTINELVDAKLLSQTASVRNISQYWNIPDVVPNDQLSAFMKASLRLIIFNPGKFMKYRLQTFAYTNGFYKNRINHPGGECIDAINNLIYYGVDYKTIFVFSNPPLGQNLRQKTIQFLSQRTYETDHIRTTRMLPVLYNCTIPLVLMIISFVWACIKKDKTFIILSLLTTLQVFLIFLTAPAMFFMYYFSFYLCGYFIFFLLITEKITEKNCSIS